MFRGLLRPGQGFKAFYVLRRKGGLHTSGRPYTGSKEPVGEIVGIISQANQKEKEQWKQSGHPITHTIVQHNPLFRGKATDVLVLPGAELGTSELESAILGKDSRRFLVQGTHDPGELGHFVIYYVEEREDLQ